MTRVHGRWTVGTRGDFALGTSETWITRRPWWNAVSGDRHVGSPWGVRPTGLPTPGTGFDRARTVEGVDPRHRGARSVRPHLD